VKLAVVYARADGRIYVRPENVMAGGAHKEGSPVVRLSESASDDDIGSALSRALEQSHAIDESLHGEFPPDTELFALAGVKSWRAFDRGTRCVGIVLMDQRVTIRPFLKLGWGRQSTEDLWLSEDLTSDARLGALVRAGLDRATS
jgi:hypothetical protein